MSFCLGSWPLHLCVVGLTFHLRQTQPCVHCRHRIVWSFVMYGSALMRFSYGVRYWPFSYSMIPRCCVTVFSTMLWLSDSVFKWTLIVPKSFMKVSSANSTDPWGIFALKFWMNSVEFCSSRLFLAFVVCDTKGVRCTVRNVNECSDAVWVMWMTGIMCCEKCEWLSLCGVRNVNDCDDVVWEMWMIVMTWCEKCDWLWWCVVRNVIDWMVWEMYDCNCLNC